MTPEAGLQGRAALVSGGGRGIGRAAALALAAAGAQVAVAARTGLELQAVAEDITAQGRNAIALPLDVADRAAVDAGFKRAEEALGAIDILVHAAAIVGPIGSFVDADPAQWRRCLEVNLLGAFNVIQAALSGMLRRGYGRIIVLSSLIASTPFPRFSAYAVGKAGVDHLTRSLAVELAGTGVAINAIYPGLTDTSMQAEIRAAPPERIGGDMWRYYHEALQQGRLLRPEAPARLILFLASPLADGLNGRIAPIKSPEAQGWLETLDARLQEGG